jgi:hypothetical protein
MPNFLFISNRNELLLKDNLKREIFFDERQVGLYI